MSDEILTPDHKALHVNLDQRRYGTFAEIGAGQEVVRWFFHVGGAAGTIAKSMSAYDMAVSDAIYGPAERYVCRPRLEAMLDYEHKLLNLGPPAREPRRHDLLLRLRRHRVRPQLQGHQRVPRLDGRAVPGLSPRPGQPDHPARADAGHRERLAAGGPGDRRRESALRGLFPRPRSRQAAGVAAGQPRPAADRDRHDRVFGHCLPAGGQPRDEPAAGAVGAEQRGDVRGLRRGAAAQRGAAQKVDPGGARQLPPGDVRQRRHAPRRP